MQKIIFCENIIKEANQNLLAIDWNYRRFPSQANSINVKPIHLILSVWTLRNPTTSCEQILYSKNRSHMRHITVFTWHGTNLLQLLKSTNSWWHYACRRVLTMKSSVTSANYLPSLFELPALFSQRNNSPQCSLPSHFPFFMKQHVLTPLLWR